MSHPDPPTPAPGPDADADTDADADRAYLRVRPGETAPDLAQLATAWPTVLSTLAEDAGADTPVRLDLVMLACGTADLQLYVGAPAALQDTLQAALATAYPDATITPTDTHPLDRIQPAATPPAHPDADAETALTLPAFPGDAETPAPEADTERPRTDTASSGAQQDDSSPASVTDGGPDQYTPETDGDAHLQVSPLHYRPGRPSSFAQTRARQAGSTGGDQPDTAFDALAHYVLAHPFPRAIQLVVEPSSPTTDTPRLTRLAPRLPDVDALLGPFAAALDALPVVGSGAPDSQRASSIQVRVSGRLITTQAAPGRRMDQEQKARHVLARHPTTRTLAFGDLRVVGEASAAAARLRAARHAPTATTTCALAHIISTLAVPPYARLHAFTQPTIDHVYPADEIDPAFAPFLQGPGALLAEYKTPAESEPYRVALNDDLGCHTIARITAPPTADDAASASRARQRAYRDLTTDAVHLADTTASPVIVLDLPGSTTPDPTSPSLTTRVLDRHPITPDQAPIYVPPETVQDFSPDNLSTDPIADDIIDHILANPHTYVLDFTDIPSYTTNQIVHSFTAALRDRYQATDPEHPPRLLINNAADTLDTPALETVLWGPDDRDPPLCEFGITTIIQTTVPATAELDPSTRVTTTTLATAADTIIAESTLTAPAADDLLPESCDLAPFANHHDPDTHIVTIDPPEQTTPSLTFTATAARPTQDPPPTDTPSAYRLAHAPDQPAPRAYHAQNAPASALEFADDLSASDHLTAAPLHSPTPDQADDHTATDPELPADDDAAPDTTPDTDTDTTPDTDTDTTPDPESAAVNAESDTDPAPEQDTPPPADSPTPATTQLSPEIAPSDAPLQGRQHIPRTDTLPTGIKYDPEGEYYYCAVCQGEDASPATARHPPTIDGLKAAVACEHDPHEYRDALRKMFSPHCNYTADDLTGCILDPKHLLFLEALRAIQDGDIDLTYHFHPVFDSMTTLRDEFNLTEDDIDLLRDLEPTDLTIGPDTKAQRGGLITRDTKPHHTYTLTPAGRALLGRDTNAGPGKRDPGETMQHHLMGWAGGLRALQDLHALADDEATTDPILIDDLPDLDDYSIDDLRLEQYYPVRINDDDYAVIDCAILTPADEIIIAIEAERINHDLESAHSTTETDTPTKRTYQKLAAIDAAEKAWIVTSDDAAHDLEATLVQLSHKNEITYSRDTPYNDNTRCRDFVLDDPGITGMYVIRSIVDGLTPPWEQ